jgi:hypothetical protein
MIIVATIIAMPEITIDMRAIIIEEEDYKKVNTLSPG